MTRAASMVAVLAMVSLPAAWAQAVISARSGMVNYVEGDVRLGGAPVKLNGAIFPQVNPGQVLYTQAGRAEILLTPGVFLRLDHNTSFRMISSKLTDTQVEILNGSALVEADEILKSNRITVKMGDSQTLLLKTGLYHFNADVGQVRTFEGKAEVSNASNSTELKGGRTLLVASSLEPDKFNKKKSRGELYAWSEERDARLALANVSAARGVNSRGFATSLWAWNPYYSMYTFLPYSGYGYSPFGMSWYSPRTVWVVLQPYSPNYGYSGVNTSWQGVAASAGSVSVAPSSNASTGAVSVSSGSSSAAVAASAGASRGRR